jgi:threonine dehydratase
MIDYTPTFVDGIGGKCVLEEMWPVVRNLIDGSVVVQIAEVAAALKVLLERNRVIAEGAGATPVAAALSGKAGGGKIACVVSGGNIDIDTLMSVVAGA